MGIEPKTWRGKKYAHNGNDKDDWIVKFRIALEYKVAAPDQPMMVVDERTRKRST